MACDEDGTVRRVFLREERSTGYYHLEGYVVTEQNGKIRNAVNWWPLGKGALDLDELTALSQGSDEDASRNERGRHLYAWEVVYKGRHCVDLEKVQTMAATLRTVHKRLDKLAETQGRPVTFGQFLGRFAVAVGAVGFVVHRGGRAGWSYDDNDHRLMSLKDGIAYADSMVFTWAQEGQEAAS